MDIKKFINSKNDINNLKTRWPQALLEYLKAEREKSLVWQKTKELAKRADGLEDETHKTQKENGNFVQLEYKLNPNCRLCKEFGYTDNELNGIIKNLEYGII